MATIDRIGQQLGNYRLIRLLGQGGFADVYLGEHLYLKTQAAIKVLHTQLTQDNMAGFIAEAQTIARLRHPHIIRVLDFGVQDNMPFLVMDYAPKGTLRQLHPKGIRLPLSIIVSYVKQIAEALDYAHSQRLIHRDIKPENMLLGLNNEILISDFGIATMAQSSHYQLTQDVVGTVSYMAPEQIQGKPRPASDEYALGIVVYEWLTGSCPFQGSFTEIASQHVFATPPSLREKLPMLSPEVEQVILMVLAKDPQQRFVSLRALANALEQASGSTPLSHTGTIIPLAPSAPTITPVLPHSELLTILPSNTGPAPTPTPVVLSAIEPLTRSPLSPGDSSPSQPPQKPSRPQSRYTRRWVLGGLGTLAVAGGGALAWFTLFQGFSSASISPKPRATASPKVIPSPTTAAPSPTPTPKPKPTPTPTSRPEPTPTPTPQPQPTASPSLFTYRGPANMYTVSWSPNGIWIASAGLGSNIEGWSANSGTILFTGNSGSAKVYSVAWSPDGTHIASGHSDGTVQVWDASGNHLYSLTAHPKQVNTVAWSPNSTYIASASADSTVKVWSASSGNLLLTYSRHTSYVNAVAWSQDGNYIASGGKTGTVHVWEAATGNRVYLYTGHSGVILSLGWSRTDASYIASSSEDSTVQVWGALTGNRLLTYRGHSDFVVALAWAPDGTRIVSGSKDTTVQVWGASSGTNFIIYRGHSAEVEGVAWSPDSSKVASASDDGTVQVWKAA